MDVAIELDNEGRIWVSSSDGTAREEAWLQGADDTPPLLARERLVPHGGEIYRGQEDLYHVGSARNRWPVMGGSLPRDVMFFSLCPPHPHAFPSPSPHA
jgi:hypothetical protein